MRIHVCERERGVGLGVCAAFGSVVIPYHAFWAVAPKRQNAKTQGLERSPKRQNAKTRVPGGSKTRKCAPIGSKFSPQCCAQRSTLPKHSCQTPQLSGLVKTILPYSYDGNNNDSDNNDSDNNDGDNNDGDNNDGDNNAK